MPASVGAKGTHGCSGYPVVDPDGLVDGGCHDKKSDAEDHAAAINANTQEADVGKRQRKRQRNTHTLTETAWTEATRTDGTIPVLVISPGWGSSGYWSEVLLAEQGPAAFPAGTHMYVDHPTRSESVERPERTLRDLAAVTTEAARWDPQGPSGPGLYARAEVFEAWRDVIDEMAPHIGLSVRVHGRGHHGEAEGRKGRIVDEIVGEALSVDFVTKAGRGGKILELVESARSAAVSDPHIAEEARNVAEWMQSRIHLHFTEFADEMFGHGRISKDERLALSSAIGSALDAFDSELSDAAPDLYDRDLFEDPSPGDEPAETEEAADMALTDEDKKDIAEIVAEALKPLAEAKPELAPEPEPKGEPEELSEAHRADREKLLYLTAHAEATRAFGEDGPLAEQAKVLPPVSVKSLVEAAAKDAPHDDDLNLDRTKLVESLTEATKARVAEFAEFSGAGRVSGMGGQPTPPDTTDRLEESFRRLGLPEDAAKVAVQGR